MRRQAATDSNKPKHASPTKRRWNSKVADILVKTLDKYDAELYTKPKIQANRLPTRAT
jgi:hypothetical protein